MESCGLLSWEKTSPFPSSQSWAYQSETGLVEGGGLWGPGKTTSGLLMRQKERSEDGGGQLALKYGSDI